MSPHQLEACSAKVVKACFIPCRGLMAVTTFRSQATNVLILAKVAVDATGFHLVIYSVAMAGRATHFLVSSLQREIGFVVVEFCFRPTGGRVTVATGNAKLIVVGVAMTVGATRTIQAKTTARFMAGAAAQFLVTTVKHELRHVVIEPIRIEPDDVGLSTKMFAVATDAICGLHRLEPAVETPLRLDICGDVLMALQAQCSLVCLVKMHVAKIALAFQVGMGFYQFARHQQQLFQPGYRIFRVTRWCETGYSDH